MTALILVLITAGILAGLVQFFVDFKKLPIFQPSEERKGIVVLDKGFWQKLFRFVVGHWEFFGYMVIGIAGAFLVPVADQLINLPGVNAYLNCIDNDPATICKTSNWYLLVIMGYGIILGYSSVRLLRSIGSFVIDNFTKRQAQQQLALTDTQKQLSELQSRFAALSPGLQQLESREALLEATTPNSGDDTVATTEPDNLEGVDSCSENPNPKPWRDWRPAASLKILLAKINTLAPARSKASDGMIGDIAHQGRDSDHNPWVWDSAARKGVVTALDITHDPIHKCDCEALASSLQAAKDVRIKYVIWNRRIMNSSSINGAEPWSWRPYSGANPHTKHIHISVKCAKEMYDGTSAWNVKVMS